MLRAKQSLDSRKFDEASRELEEVDVKRLPIELKPLYFSVLAALHEKSQDFEAAFDSFSRMNSVSSQLLPPDWEETRFDPVRPYDTVPDLLDDYDSEIQLTFIVGFPRSGTTLLQTILDTQRSISVIDEKPIVHKLKEQLILDGFDLSNCLSKMNRADRDRLRTDYFKLAGEYIQDFSTTEMLVDKNPLQMIDLPLIATLLPRARFLFTIRQPLDVLISCYQQTFEANSQMAYFLDWESCFTHYSKVFRAYHENLEKLHQVEPYVVRYESLIQDFESEAEHILGYLGLKSDKPALTEFSTRAHGTMINTPSSSQVRQGVYTSSAHRWENYSKFVKPYVHRVRDAIVRYGYNDELVSFDR